MRLDVVIFGGGVAGLWLLDQLTRQGSQCLLLEANALGQGQTIASQGIIHGGLKYSLQGLVTRSAKSVREMPATWRESLCGHAVPILVHTRLRSPECHLWQTESLASRIGMLSARLALHVTPEVVPPELRPAVLKHVPGMVARLAEPVVCVHSLLTDFAQQYREQILKIDAQHGVSFDVTSPGEVRRIRLTMPGQPVLTLEPRHVVLMAGAGNGALRTACGLDSESMQRRPLQMLLARGPLPELNGHCVDGAQTRVTITSDVESSGRMVWQIGGQIAEDGVHRTESDLIRQGMTELKTVLPGIDLAEVEWSTYRIDRAEGATAGGARPSSIQVLCGGNVTTGWPTKLALAPLLAQEVASRVCAGQDSAARTWDELANWPRPDVATLPWHEADRVWWSTATLNQTRAA